MTGCKLKLGEVTYFNAEHPKHKVKNLLTRTGKWTCPSKFQGDLTCEFSLAAPARITRIDLGNYWSASVEIYVGLESWPISKRELLASHNFMNRLTSLSGDNKEQLLTFTGAHFKEVSERQWDRIRVTCKQPYKYDNDCFGLSMIDITGVQKEINLGQPSGEKSSEIDEKDIKDFIEKKFQSMKSVAKPMSSSTLMHALSGSTRPSSISSPSSDTSRSSPSTSTMRPSTSTSSPSTSMGPPSSPAVFRSSSSGNKQKSSLTKSARNSAADEIDAKKEDGSQDFNEDFAFKCLNFLEKTISFYGFDELSVMSYNNVKELWINNFGSDVTSTEKKILKKLSRKFISDRLEKLMENPNNIAQETRDAAKEQFEKHKEKAERNPVIDGNSSSLSDLAGKSKNLAGKSTKKRRLSSASSDGEEKENKSKRANRNSIISMDLRDDGDPGDLDLVRSDRKKSGKKTPNKSSVGGGTSSSSAGKSRKKDIRMKAIPDRNGWIKTGSPSEGKIRMIEKSLTPLHSKAVLGYDIGNLLRMPIDLLKKHGILFQKYNYKRGKDLPLKNGNKLYVERLAPVYFYKCGPNIHLVYQNRIYDPDVEEHYKAGIFKSHDPSEVLNNKPLNNKVIDLINNYVEEEEEEVNEVKEVKEVVINVSDDEDDRNEVVGNRMGLQGNRAAEGGSNNNNEENRVECPLCAKMFSSSIIGDHASECTGPSGQDDLVPVDTCPLCSRSMDPDLLAVHAASCTGEVDGNDDGVPPPRSPSPRSPASRSGPEVSSGSPILQPGRGPTSVRNTHVTAGNSTHHVTAGNRTKDGGYILGGSSSSSEVKMLKYGDCPVCERRMKIEELREHATGCQGFALNGGNGLHVNVMDSQRKCDFCEQLIPEVVMDEHVDECPARGIRQRVLTPVEKKISQKSIRNSFR